MRTKLVAAGCSVLADSLGLGQLQLDQPERLVAMTELRNRTGFQQMPFYTVAHFSRRSSARGSRVLAEGMMCRAF